MNVAEEKNYIESETRFVPLGGETCGVYVPRRNVPVHWPRWNDYTGRI